MNLEQYPRLREAIDLGYDFDIGKYINQGFELFKQNVGGFVAYTFVYMAILMVIGIIPVLGNIASIVIAPPLAVGWYLVANKIRKSEPSEFNDFFRGFDFIGPLILITLVSSLIYVVALIPFFISTWTYLDLFSDLYEIGSYDLERDFPFWTFLFFLPLVYLGVAWRWASMFVIFHKMGFWEAMETSRRLVTRRWGNHFVLLLVFMLFALGGMLAFFIGLIFVIPMITCMEYAAFADVTRLRMETGERSGDDIVDHLVD